jgi:hypothetical protein
MVEQACAEFDRDVFFGKYDREGYTPAERKAQQIRNSRIANKKAVA